jgi:hypothetical protein
VGEVSSCSAAAPEQEHCLPPSAGAECSGGGRRRRAQFVDDKRHGFGTYTYPDGDVYSGEFRFGAPEPRTRRPRPAARAAQARRPAPPSHGEAGRLRVCAHEGA